MKATVDEELCIGCGLCQDTCPDVFELMDDGYSHVICDQIGEELYECVREAAEVCPTEAITFSEE
jgi:ferredoxin